jgi:5'-nucleotidase/UDP-sugar diphosphatase
MNRTRRAYSWIGPLALALVFGLAACSDDDVVEKYDFGPDPDGSVDIAVDMPVGETSPDMSPDAPPPVKQLVILQTTDMHDHLMGHAPVADFTAATQGDDTTMGGFARLAAQIAAERTAAGTNGVLLLDSGDWSMGSLFRFIGPTKAPTLSLMQDMGYDAITLGNHEFEWSCDALALNISTAMTAGFKVPIVASNIKFDATDAGDDNLEKLKTAGAIKDTLIKTVDGVKVGIIGLLGDAAAAVVPTKAPLQVIGEGDGNETDPTKRKLYPHVQAIVDGLRNTDKVDLVIALSHSGISLDQKTGKPNGKGDDELLAKYVTGIDVIVSGHTHKVLTETLKVQDDTKKWTTLIVQAGAYTKGLGKLELGLDKDNKITSDKFTTVKLDDAIKADTATQTKIDNYIKDVDAALAAAGLAYKAPIAETAFDLTMTEFEESNLGDLVTDSYLTIYNTLNPTAKADVAIENPGTIRDDILKGKTGQIWFADLYRAHPLGIGPDQKPGYPLVAVHISSNELKMAMELLNLAEGPLLNNNDYFLQIAGMEVTYTKGSVPTLAVTGIKVGGTAIDLTSTTTCHKVVTNYYLALLLGKVSEISDGGLQITPKESDCTTPITDFTKHFVDADPTTTGVQELKVWQALLKYVTGFPDADADKIPDIPAIYKTAQGRVIKK